MKLIGDSSTIGKDLPHCRDSGDSRRALADTRRIEALEAAAATV